MLYLKQYISLQIYLKWNKLHVHELLHILGILCISDFRRGAKIARVENSQFLETDIWKPS